ncbi:MAG: hypothetical protein V1717_00850 [Candidatus Micrarchaeota archaeon]
MLAFVPFVFFIFEIFETLSELDFVIRVMVFSYMLFWLYTTFMPAQAEILFGISGIVAGYLVFAHGISLTILVLFFIFFILLGSQIQMILMFGLLPLLGYQYAGDRFVKSDAVHGSPSSAEALTNQYYSPGLAMGAAEAEEEQALAMRTAAARMRR